MSVLALAALAAWTGCGDDGSSPSGPDDGVSDVSLAVEEVATGLSRPLHLTSPVGDPRLFVVEQGGVVRVIGADGTLQSDPYLDITGRVSAQGEQGLLSLVFHPDFGDNGRFFVNFTDTSGDTRVEEFVVDDPATSTVTQTQGSLVLGVDQPYSNHNGGLLRFGPDGMLWIGLGDGGGSGDPDGNGQDTTTLLGSMLRIDVDGDTPYEKPPDNPFVGESGRDEIFAYGLRNPWRFAFDRSRGLLYVADVGQSSWEEVSVIPADSAGVNFGWNVMEGAHCYADSCDTSGLLLPAVEYPTSDGCAIIGGEVYRGDAIPELRGHYFYADFCSLRLRSFRYREGEEQQPVSWDVGSLGRPLGFGRDSDGELYLLMEGGSVYRFVEEGS